MTMDNKQKRRSNRIMVQPQTLYHLHILADLCGYKTLGPVVDKLVREKREEMSLHVSSKRKSDSR